MMEIVLVPVVLVIERCTIEDENEEEDEHELTKRITFVPRW